MAAAPSAMMPHCAVHLRKMQSLPLRNRIDILGGRSRSSLHLQPFINAALAFIARSRRRFYFHAGSDRK